MKVGFFGKLPGYGDFVQRGVSPDFVKFWDTWVMQALESSRSQLGEQWQHHYFHSPIWCFSLNRGVAGAEAITGLLMPSVDKAGRCYPFTVICQSEQPLNILTMSRYVDGIHEKTEEFLLSLLEKDSPNLDELQSVLENFYHEFQELQCQNLLLRAASSYGEIGSLVGNNLEDFSRSNETFLQSLLKMQSVDLTLWWMSGGVNTLPQKRYFSGMPPVDSYSSFLLGVSE